MANISKPKYLSNINHLLRTYSLSKDWSENEKALIKTDRVINLKIYNTLVQSKYLSDSNNIVKFNQTEIDKSYSEMDLI